MNSYELSRVFVDFSFENPTKIKPNHYALYFFAIEHCNRLGWKKEFGLPTTMVMEAVGIKSYNTYIKSFNELVSFGFFELIERSKNQYSANIIALSNYDKALNKALDKALIKHGTKQRESTEQSIDSIDKQINNKQINNKQVNVPSVKKPKPLIDFVKLLAFINKTQKREGVSKFKVINKSTQGKYLARLKEGYTTEQISNSIKNSIEDKYHKETNYKYLTPEFFSRAIMLDKHGVKTTVSRSGVADLKNFVSNPHKNL